MFERFVACFVTSTTKPALLLYDVAEDTLPNFGRNC